ncbi:MAG: arginine N-succinyltransferase [Chloroflexi bacterium]|nr:arginine N-succinyltransferase [Chloroflexota bacterium]
MFEVGEIYENRLGEYRVIDIDRRSDEMILRYLDTGERLETSVTLQRRIFRNITWQYEEEAKQRRREKERALRGHGDAFEGLDEDDFSMSIRGTSWRRRENLPGYVARELSFESSTIFSSWAIPYTPAAMIAPSDDAHIYFHLEVNEERVYYGLAMDPAGQRTVRAIRNSERVRQAILNAEDEYGARLIAVETLEDDRATYMDALAENAELWDPVQSAEMSLDERIAQVAEEDEDTTIYLLARMPREQAIELGEDVGTEIARMMATLLPVYNAIVLH